MASNNYEWTTEYCTYATSSNAYPCASRGGGYDNNNYCTEYRNSGTAVRSNSVSSFRTTLYM